MLRHRWSNTQRSQNSLEVHLLGRVDFHSARLLQERLVADFSEREDQLGGLILCEHPPMLTIGREGSREHWKVDEKELTARRMSVTWSNRGGGCLVHAPGQLAVYPVVPLKRLGMGLNDYRTALEEAILRLCNDRKVVAHRREDQPGVWCRYGQLAHLGVAVKSWIAYHGIFLNVDPVLDLFQLVQCNPTDERVTSLAMCEMQVPSMSSVRENLIHHLARRLGYLQYNVHTGHPLLTRRQQSVAN